MTANKTAVLRFFPLLLLAACCSGQQSLNENEFFGRYADKLATAREQWQAERFDKAQATLETLRRDPDIGLHPAERANVEFQLARTYARLGKNQKAAESLRLAARFGLSDPSVIEKDPDLNALPAIKDILRRIRPAGAALDGPAIATPYRDELSEAEKIAGLSKVWAEVKHNFAWFDSRPDLDWDALYLRSIPKVQKAKTTFDYYRILKELVAELKDGHTSVFPPNDLLLKSDWRPPVETRMVEGKVLVVEADSDLAEGGLKPGAEILEVDGIDAREYARRNIEPYESASTRQGLEFLVYTQSLLAGPKDTTVELTCEDERGERFRRALKRTVRRFIGYRKPFDFEVVEGNIGYLTLNTFGDDRVATAFEAAFEAIEKTSGLVIDLRHNGGGNESVGRRILRYFFDKPFETSVRATRKNIGYDLAQGKTYEWVVWPQPGLPPHGSKFYSKPIVALIGKETASAAENFVISLDIMKRAMTIGEPTFGSTGQPLRLRLPGGGALAICTVKAWYPDGRDFVGAGIQPDVLMGPTVASIRTGDDMALNTAVDYLRKGIAGNGAR